MSDIPSVKEAAIEAALIDFVKTRLSLGIYDPMQIRRPRVEIVSFQIELLEMDDSIVHVAGPVVLRTPQGDVENFLRLSVEIQFHEGVCHVPENATVRAAYIVETDHPNGACKETAALANA